MNKVLTVQISAATTTTTTNTLKSNFICDKIWKIRMHKMFLFFFYNSFSKVENLTVSVQSIAQQKQKKYKNNPSTQLGGNLIIRVKHRLIHWDSSGWYPKAHIFYLSMCNRLDISCLLKTIKNSKLMHSRVTNLAFYTLLKIVIANEISC